MATFLGKTTYVFLTAALSWSFLAGIFLAPIVSALLVGYSIMVGWWTVWHLLPLAHLFLVATSLLYLWPAFVVRQ